MGLKIVPYYKRRASQILVDCCIKNFVSFPSLSAPLICTLKDDSINTLTQNYSIFYQETFLYITICNTVETCVRCVKTQTVFTLASYA